MHYPDKAKAAAQAYFSSFARLFGETPNFPTGEERLSALRAMENIILSTMQTYGGDPALSRIIETAAIDFMEEVIETYK
ncbi:hypothetical protein HWC54_gp133 [Klebsiella phage Marfa]|uniref:Uncharacterized protein n=1 Tax=Klebsiella phage Marfa TaxID=2587809 RepID=A0A4Y5TQX5_9CAUD|nr:hypothetical protein HWC54_gp133 [Klebsiella phage Marfa]QDB71788.1 hypothetical protein CPT_Marfa_133 [Klebsiella phage Marfa]